jgi:hypothetical protein
MFQTLDAADAKQKVRRSYFAYKKKRRVAANKKWRLNLLNVCTMDLTTGKGYHTVKRQQLIDKAAVEISDEDDISKFLGGTMSHLNIHMNLPVNSNHTFLLVCKYGNHD